MTVHFRSTSLPPWKSMGVMDGPSERKGFATNTKHDGNRQRDHSGSGRLLLRLWGRKTDIEIEHECLLSTRKLISKLLEDACAVFRCIAPVRHRHSSSWFTAAWFCSGPGAWSKRSDYSTNNTFAIVLLCCTVCFFPPHKQLFLAGPLICGLCESLHYVDCACVLLLEETNICAASISIWGCH